MRRQSRMIVARRINCFIAASRIPLGRRYPFTHFSASFKCRLERFMWGIRERYQTAVGLHCETNTESAYAFAIQASSSPHLEVSQTAVATIIITTAICLLHIHPRRPKKTFARPRPPPPRQRQLVAYPSPRKLIPMGRPRKCGGTKVRLTPIQMPTF